MIGNVRGAWGRARILARALVQTGMVFGVSPAALPAIARQRLRGGSSLATVVQMHAAARPDRPALIGAGRRLSWADLEARVEALGRGLYHHHGIRPGDPILLVMRNRPELLEAQIAASRIGASAVSVSWRSTAEELEYLVEHSGARAIIVENEIAEATLSLRGQTPAVPRNCFIGVGDARDGRDHPDALVAYEQVIAGGGAAAPDASDHGTVVIYTSGTTGRPKGAVRGFPREMQDAVLRFLVETPIRQSDRHLAVCPMYHSTAFGFISFTMAVGGAVVVSPTFDPELFLSTVEAERITSTAVVPTMLYRVLDLPDEVLNRYDTSSLRAVFCGGAPLSGALARRFMERFGHVLYNFYGSTETGINTLAGPEELLLAPGTIGHAVGGNDLRLLGEDGKAVLTGQTGELFVKNAMLVAGYHRDDAATEASMRDGYFSVGDLAHQDARGLFHLDGRKRDMVISGGVNVYPREVEAVLTRHPAIAEAAVVGVEDEEWGERVRAFVRTERDMSVDAVAVIAFARQHLAGPKVPREVFFLDELPKNATGKVLKRELREYRV